MLATMLLTGKVLKAALIGSVTNPLGPDGPETFWDVVTSGLGIVIPLAGIMFVAMFVYAGITYIMSAGDAGKVKSAQAMMTNALIGMVIIAFAFVVQALVVKGITGASPGVGSKSK